MSDNGTDFLDDMTQPLVATETPEKPEPEQPEAVVETVDTPPEAPAPEVTTTPEPKEEQAVPYAAMKAERDKRQALERELSELRAAQPQQPAPEFFDAPEQHMQALEQRATQRLYAALEEQARVVHPDYDEVFEEVKAAAEGNPAIQQRIFSSANPALAAYQIGKQLREFKRMEDPVKYRAEIEAEVRTKLEAELKAKEQARAAADAAIPPDMTQSRNAAGQFAPSDSDVFDDLFNK
ncbi:hypothetical protein ABB26_04995 [Stenotrophomonas humi]|uniref:Scaffolding protein n=1 Tax=Stenotrophomonas humi TaxID=405444 RepID=A0A0R0CIX3_9GAMM|nr:hypothetical protein [Stenotrophomonas humi]KRG65171.1 hypothetical protein ABB26_04995 [Stenotrophomonas humi]